MAEKHPNVEEDFVARSRGIKDLPELAVEPTPEKSSSGAAPIAVAKVEKVSLAVEDKEASIPQPHRKGFLGMVSKVRTVLPVVAKLLPLLDAPIAAALAPMASALVAAPAANTKAMERTIAELQAVQRDLRTHVQNHNVQLKRVEEHLMRVREEVERHAQEQQSKIEEIQSATRKLKGIAIFAVVLLVVVIGLQGWILFRLHH